MRRLSCAAASRRGMNGPQLRILKPDVKEVPPMPKKKKKVRTLTEQQYNDYLMALKDERPTMLIDKNGRRTPQK